MTNKLMGIVQYEREDRELVLHTFLDDILMTYDGNYKQQFVRSVRKLNQLATRILATKADVANEDCKLRGDTWKIIADYVKFEREIHDRINRKDK